MITFFIATLVLNVYKIQHIGYMLHARDYESTY